MRWIAGLAAISFVLAGGPVLAEDEEGMPVEGVEGAMLSNIQAYVGLWGATDEEIGNKAIRRHLVASADEEVALALAPFGYYHATLEIVEAGDGSIERLVIDPGPPTLVSSMEVVFENAELDPDFDKKLRGLLQLSVGARLDHPTYEDGKRAIESALLGAGRLSAELVEHEVLVDRGLDTASIELRWNVGPEHYFGPVRFVGSPFGDDFMKRYVNI